MSTNLHTLMQACFTVLNPLSVMGMTVLGEMLERPKNLTEIVGEVKESLEVERLWRRPIQIFGKPKLVTNKIAEELKNIEKQEEKYQQNVASVLERQAARQARRRKPLLFLTAVTLSLPMGLSVYHHAVSNASDQNPITGIAGDMGAWGIAHLSGLISGLMSAGLLGTRFGEAGWKVGGLIARLGVTFATSFFLTKWWG